MWRMMIDSTKRCIAKQRSGWCDINQMDHSKEWPRPKNKVEQEASRYDAPTLRHRCHVRVGQRHSSNTPRTLV